MLGVSITVENNNVEVLYACSCALVDYWRNICFTKDDSYDRSGIEFIVL